MEPGIDAEELRYLEKLEEVNAEIISLEQKLADDPGNKIIPRLLASAKFQQGRWEMCLSSLQRLREFLPRSI